jgi:glycerol uptake facilitator-like aquaporin
MVLVGILATISILEAGYSSPVLYIAIFQGLILSLAILAAGPATGGHVNPCITFTEMLTGHISPVRCLLYILAQSLGSIVAAFWVKVSTISPPNPKFSHSTHFWLAMEFPCIGREVALHPKFLGLNHTFKYTHLIQKMMTDCLRNMRTLFPMAWKLR